MIGFSQYVTDFLEGKELVKAVRASNNTVGLFYREVLPENDWSIPPTKYKERTHVQVETLEDKSFEVYVNSILDGRRFIDSVWLNGTDLLIFFDEPHPDNEKPPIRCIEIHRYNHKGDA